MSGDKFDQLYNALKADGAVSGTRENFKKYVYAPGKQGYQNRKQLYDALHADGAVSSGSYEEFAQRLGLHATKQQKQTTTQQTQPKQQVSKPQTAAQMAMSQGYKSPQNWEKQKVDVDYLRGTQRIVNKPLKGAPKNASPFVQSLYAADDEKREMDNNFSTNETHNKPWSTKLLLGENRIIDELHAKDAADKIVNDETRRRNQPIVKTETPADDYVVKTQGQLEDEASESAKKMIDSDMGDYLDKAIGNEFKAAHQRGLDALAANGNGAVHGTGGADWWIGERAYQQQMDADKQLENIVGGIKKNVETIFSNENVKQKVLDDAASLGVDPEYYIKNQLAPALIEKANDKFSKTQLARMMPQGASDYIAGGILDSMTGTILAGLASTKSQRQMQQQANAMTDEGENPNYKPGMGARVARGTLSFATDAMAFKGAGIGANAATEAVFGNAAKQAARMANANVARRVFTGIGRGVLHGGVTGFQYGAANAVVQNYSTGEDTSLGNTLKQAAIGGTSEAASFAAMEGLGGAVGGFGHKIGLNGTEKGFLQKANKVGQKITYEAVKTGMEGIGMATGGVASSYARHLMTGEDWQGFTVEGTLESCANAVAFKLMHAKDLFKREVDPKTGKRLGIGGSLAMKAASFLSSDAAKSQRFVFTDEEKHQLFNAGAESGLSPVSGIFDLAKKAKSTNPEDVERAEDGSDVLTYYQQIMQDPNVSWDAKAKFSTFVMGTMPESRPMYDHYAVGTENDFNAKGDAITSYNTISEYAADGTLLSKRRYDTKDKRESIIYELSMKREGSRLQNAIALVAHNDKNNYELQNAFFAESMKNPKSDVGTFVTDMGTEGSDVFRNFTDFVMNAENGKVMQTFDAIAKQNGMERKDLIKASNKDPMKRTDAEQNACIQLRHALEDVAFPRDKVHEEQSHLQGKDVAEDNGLGTEKPNGEAVKQELNNLSEAENELEQLIKDNDVFGQNFENLQKQRLTNPQIYGWMLDNGLTEEQLAPFAHYINANARVQGMQNATQQMIEQKVSAYMQDWSLHGTINGQEAKGEQVVWVQDKSGRTLVVGSGEMAFDSTNGRAKEGVGDMLVCLDPNTGEMVYTKVDDVTFFQTQKPEDFGNEYRNKLQQINSQAYNEAAQEQAAKNANLAPQDNTTKPKDDTTSAKDSTTNTTYLDEETGKPLVEGGSTSAENNPSVQENPIINDGKGGTDNMGNTLNSDGSIYTEPVKSVSEITDNDFDTPSRSVELPSVPDNVSAALGAEGKPVIIKKNIFEKNANNHPELDAADSRAILENALYNPNLVGQTQPVKRPSYKVAVQTGDKNSIVVLDVYNDKKQVEIVGWRLINEKGLVKMKRQAEREGGQFLILSPKVGSAAALSTLPHGSSSAGKDTNNSSNGNGSEVTLTFKDGNSVPMTTDSKGRPTPDYGKMTAEQAADVMTQQFGEDAEKVADAQIKKAEKALKNAEKMKVDFNAEPNDILEQKQIKDGTIAAAKEQLQKAQDVKKALTAQKVAETMKPKENEAPVDGAHEAGSVAAEKFQKATRLKGNTVTKRLPTNEKVSGHYEIVPAESLTPSHDVHNGYKKSEGFPVDAEGRTINDRDYENNKAAQQTTDQMAQKYSGQAITQVPTVSDEGIVYDGNGRTMAGQKAAKQGTDAEYIEDLMDNAQNYGFTKEQIAESGIEHPRLVMVTDERLPYDTATFAKFNRNEKKSQSNTEQAVAKAKTLTADEVGAIVADIEGNGSLDAFFNNSKAINDLVKTLVSKGVIGQNEVDGFMDGTERLSAQGKEYVKNLLLGSVFKPETIRMLGFDPKIKNAAINGIRSIMDNLKLGDYSLRDEIDQAVQLLYEARRSNSTVEDLLKQSSAFDENARDRFSQVAQAIAQALEGNTATFRDLMREYNDIAKSYNTGEADMFGEHLSPEELVKQFLEVSKTIKNNDIKLYGNESRHPEQEGGNHAASNEEPAKEAGGAVGTEGSEQPESQERVNEALKHIATEITKQTGIEVVTDEKVGQSTLEDAEATDSNVKYSRVTDEGLIKQLDKEPKIKVYRAMQVIDGKLYPPMAAYADGKLVEANELGKWIQADEMPDSKNIVYKYRGKQTTIPKERAVKGDDGVWRDSKNGAELVVGEDGEPTWYFKLVKGKGATGKKLAEVPAVYNPYWHTSYSPLNDQFKSAWIRPNVVVVECEVPASELNSGYRAEHAKDHVGMTPWTSGIVTTQLIAQGHEGRKVMLSRWCKPVRILPDAEVASRIKDFIGGYDVEIPENVVTPRQKVELEKLGVKIGAPEKGMNKNEQIADAIRLGLQVVNTVKEQRGSRWAGGAVLDWGNVPSKARVNNDELTTIIMQNNSAYIGELDKLGEGETIEHYVDANGYFYTFRVDKNHHIYMDEAIPKTSSANRERISELKNYYNEERARHFEKVRSDRGKSQSELGRPADSDGSTAGGRNSQDSAVGGGSERTDTKGNVERDSSRSEQSGSQIKEFRSKNGEVYGFTVDGKIYLDTKKMKPETPLHEYTHLWTAALKRANPKEWENVKKLFDEVEGLKEEVSKLYPELKGDDLYEEMITTYSGREGAKKLEEVVRGLASKEGKTVEESSKAQGFLDKVKTALQKYWKGVADMLHIHFTSAEEVADKVLADWAKGVNPKDVKATEEKPEPSKDPIEGLNKAAEGYNESKLDAARKAYEEAKKSGDESEIKRTRDELKQKLDEKYKAQGMGLIARRKEIAKEIGKAEAAKIDKPWSEMDLEEREAVSSKNPLTEDEINELTSEENRELIPAALAYLRGDKGNIVNAISYFKIWNDVRNRHENAPDNSGAGDGTQLAATDTTGGEGLGLGTGRDSRGTDGQLDRGTGGEPSPGERTSGEGDKTDPAAPAGEPSDKQGEGNTPGMGAVPARGADTKGGSAAGTDGNKPQRGGRKGGNRPAKPDAKRKPAAKQGTHFPNSTTEQLKQERAEYEKKKADFWARWKKAGQGYAKIALTPFKKLNLTPEQIEMLPELFKMHLNGAVLKIKEGIFKFKEWKAAMMNEAGEELKMIGLTDDDVDRFMDDYWNTPFEMDGESHTISEWAGIYGNEQLREKIKEPLNEKYQKQMAAEPIKVKVGDRKNIEETLPYLLPQQQEDVLKAETQFFGKKHADRDHAYGKGYMFTNGTGTGKTYTGLGIAKRLAKQGKGRILFVTPSQKKVSDWVKDGKNLGLDIRDLDSVAKEKGTTATTESGEGMVITTYANMRANKKLLETEWDAVIYDESHRIMENKKGTETAGSQQHYMLTNRDENHTFLRLKSINKHYQKMQSAADKFNALRQKEIERIQKEYKQSHPSATTKDIINATYSKQPKDIASFAPADGMTFPKLGKAYQDFTQAREYYLKNVEPKLKEQAKQTWKNTKTVFLSATPFNTRENLDYAEGYIFKFPENNGNGRIDPRSQFYLDHFGAAYRFRYNRLEAKTDNPDAIAKQEIAFSDYLQNTLGTMSGRIIDSAYDYSRDFPTVAPDHAEDFNSATQEAMTGRYLGEAYRKTIGDYNYGSALFETMKTANIIGRMKEHLDAGRKIVVFHRRVETKEPIQPPFAYMLSYANAMIKEMKPGKEKEEAIAEANEFRRKYADLLQWEQTLDYSMPREQIAKAFGKDNVLFFSGKESKGAKSKAVDVFNDDNSGKNIIVIQEASGKEGISLHDTTGNHQRVLITLGLPQSPITALQVEGRTYRIGNKSNAIFEYPILGLNSEMMLFGEKFNNQVSTTENLALGSKARNLRDSFANGVLEHSGIVPIDQQGVGGKEFDAPKQSDTDPFDDAVLDYYSNQKLNKRNREGVDYFPTPEPLGYKMVEWANMGEGDTALEPSAGHGAIARYIPKENQLLSIEPSQSLFTKLQLKAGGLGRKFLNNMFENYDVSNKHDVVVMNPPFGTAGATAIAHLDKAFRHLDEGGRVVAIIPRGSTDKKFDKWYDGQKNIAMRAEVDLPDIVFQQAGTSVRCRVVVLDKITDAALRSKAGYPEKIDLSGHYDKIEDFFEDLRDVQIPDRIIDTQLKDIKKARSFKKELESIKGISVSIEKRGISVFDKNNYHDYSIAFSGGVYNKERLRSNLADKYEQFDQAQQTAYNENSKAALEEMKKLACKLADMSEDEMQKYISDRKNGGVHFREERGVQYSETDAKDVKKGRIIPEEVGKSVSSQIEKKFDDAVEKASAGLSEEENTFFRDVLDLKVREFSHLRASDIENQLKAYEYDYREWSTKFGGNGNGTNIVRRKAAEYRAAAIAAEREMDYRKVRTDTIRDNYGLQGGGQATVDALARIFEKDNRGKQDVGRELLERASLLLKKIGTEISVEAEAPEANKNALGSSGIHRDINLYIDTLARTSVKSGELGTTILHEMIHQVANGAINLVKKGKAEGALTPKQIEAVNTILDIYNKVKDDTKRFRENTYGLQNEYELTAQMADPRQRKAMDLSIWDRVVNAAHELARKGDRSILQRLKGAVKKLFEVSDKDKMDKAINDIMDDFNETIDDISMNEIEKDGFANSAVKLSDNAPIVVKHIANVAEKVGGKVNMVQSAGEVTNPQAKKAIGEGKEITGWYDEKTGEVHLYMPNIHDRYTAEKTIWHEVVGHKGMRELFGEDRFDKFLDSVWYDLDKPENASLKKLVMEEMQQNPFDYRNAIEEGVARLAEEGRGDAGFWRNIKNKVTDFLHEIGYRIAPNTKDVKYLLWLSKNLQKNPNDAYYKMRAEAVKYHIDHEDIPAVTERGGMFHDNTGRIYHDMSELPKAEYQEMTDGKVHFRTTPSTGTALDRYDRALNAHGYMATESFMDNMLSLKELMKAVDPTIKKIEDVKSSENPYILQNTMQGAMSNAAQMFERNVMKPLDKAMAGVLDAFDGKKDEEKIRNFNLYMITKHGLERNRVFFVRDYITKLRADQKTVQDAEILQKQWDAEKKDLGDKLRNGSIDLKEYYEEMDEWIRNSVDKDFKAEEHDYSGMHGLQGLKDNKAPYDDAAAIQSVMDSEANMESVKAGSVKDFWSKVHAATSYSLYCDYANGFQSRETYTKTSQMFDWYVPLRKFDEQTAEDVYGYVTEKGDPSGYIGSVLMSAKGRKSLSEVNVLAQIGAMGNMAISNGGKNAIKQAFMRFARSHDSQGLITEGQVWLVKDGTNADGSDRWVEAYPQIPDGAAPKTVSNAIRQFEADMKAKQATGNAKIMRNAADIGYKFERAKDKSQHVVDVKVNGKTHRFYINGNPRAAQALNGMLENKGTKYLKHLSAITRTMAQLCTSFSPEFVVRNIVRDMQFASSNVTAKEGAKYGGKWGEYYAMMLPIGAKNISLGDIKGSSGLGLYAKYRNGTLDMNNKIHKYFKEFMENGGETGWVQVLSMKDWEKKYKRDIKAERSKLDKGGKAVKDFFFGNLENLNEAAENMARFATYCTSRDYGRSAVRSAYDAKEVSTNFNRHGSGDSVWSFKNGEMGGFEKARRGTYGFIASYLRQCSMFFNAGIQSTNLLKQNFKAAPKGTITAMMAMPFGLGIGAALLNNWLIAQEDEKDRNGVKDPYAELPDYIRRNNLCIYKGGGEFITIPLAIELRAFYGLGDLAIGMTFAKNIKSTRDANLTGVEAVDKYLNPFMDAVGCISQLVPVMDYTNSHAVDKNPGKETLKALTPSAASPLVEWWMNSDWKGAPIRRETTSYNEYAPAWQRAYKNTPQMFMNLNKKVNAMTNDVAPGNEDMLGNGFLDAVTNPAALNHYLGGFGGGAATFGTRLAKLATADKVETNDIPFLRSFLYKPNEQSSMQRTKSKWYNYVESMEKTMSNVDRLKSKNVPIDKRLENIGAYYKFKDSKEAQMADIIERAQKYMKRWKQMRDKSSDATAIDNANGNIDLIMQDAVEQLDKLQ